MSTKTLTRSFGGGEVTPELFGRLDLAKFQTGLRGCLNCIVLPHGPATSRTGFEYVLRAKYGDKKAIPVPFIYSTEQAYILEFGNEYVRFHTEGGTVLEDAQSITSVTVDAVATAHKTAHGYSDGDWLYLSDVVGMAGIADRFVVVASAGADSFALHDLFGDAINTLQMEAFTSGNMARVYEIASPYLEADLPYLNFTQSADVLTVVMQGYQQAELRRAGATDWSFTLLSFTPVQVAPTSPVVTATVGTGTDVHRYKIGALAGDGLEESLGSAPAVSTSTAITGATVASPCVVTSVAHGRAVSDPVYVSGIVGMTELAGEYLVDTIPTADTLTLRTMDGVVVDSSAFTAYTSGGTLAYAAITNDLTTAGNKNTVKWTDAADAVRYNVYKEINGLWGYIGQATTGFVGFVDDNYAPDISRTPPEANDPFVGSDNYPGAVGYYGGRRWFAGTANKPQNAWATRSGTEKNMSFSIPTRDDDSIAVRLTSRQANTIRHLVDLSDLIVLASGAEWKLVAANSDVITPSTIDNKPIDTIGASHVRPVITNGAVVYAQALGGRVREMRYTWEAQNYKTVDVCVLAPHLFDTYEIASMTYARAPFSVVWAVRDDGTLLGMTYLPEQDVRAWHRHTTTGEFEAVASIPEGRENVLYAVVKREIDGHEVRYIERMHTRQFETIADCFFVDAGASYEGTAATVIGGLWHLRGEAVVILADGAVQPPQTVAHDGTVTLEVAASKVHVGLSYNADLETLPLSIEAAAGFGQGAVKNINTAHIRVNQSSGIFVGPGFDKLREFKQRTTEPYGSPPALIDGVTTTMLTPQWNQDAPLCIRQPHPLPLTVLALVLEVTTGG